MGCIGPDPVCEAAGEVIEHSPAGQIIGSVNSATEGIESVLSFASDPLGYLAEKTQDGARSLAETVLPAMADALQPDLDADWFIDSYRITFALAVLAWVCQLAWGLVQTSRKRVSSSEMVDIIVARSPIFLLGCMFGPAVGGLFVRLMGALTDDIIRRTVGGSVESVGASIETLIDEAGPAEVAGGAMIAIFIYIAMIIGLLMCVLTMIVMLVTLYLSGVMFPLAFQYLTSPTQQARAWSIAKIWVGILLAHPLMFLLLGFSLKMAAGTLLEGQLPGEASGAPEGFRVLAGLLVCVVALWMTALSPWALSKLAPVLPTGSGAMSGGVDSKSMSMPGLGSKKSNSMANSMGDSTRSGSNLDAGAGVGGGGGGDEVLAAVGGGGSAAETGAMAGAEKAAVAGAETGPMDLGVAAVGAAAGAMAGAAKDGLDHAGDQGLENETSGPQGSGDGGGSAAAGAVSDGASGTAAAAAGDGSTLLEGDQGSGGGSDVDDGGGTSAGGGGVSSAMGAGDAGASDSGSGRVFAPAGGEGQQSSGVDDLVTPEPSERAGSSSTSSTSSARRTAEGARRVGSGLSAMLDGAAAAAVAQAEDHSGPANPPRGGQGGGGS